MERRRDRRIKRRLTCEFFHGASSHRGIILDLGPTGVFIRSNAVLAPGSEIDIHLAASVAAPAMTLRGCVVRRRSVPATLTTLIQPGIGVRILDAPREFGLLTSDCELDEAIETDYDFGQAPNADPSGVAGPSAPGSKPAAGSGERERAAQGPPHANATPAKGASGSAKQETPSEQETPSKPARPSTTKHAKPARASATKGAKTAPPPATKEAKRAKKAEERGAQRSRRIETPAPPRPVSAVLVGGTVLDEIAEMLRDLGVETIRCGPYDPQLTALDDACLLVVSGEIAMSDPIPVDTDRLVGIAVCGDSSETVRSQIRQQGYRYLLRSHLHPEALRLLLRYAVYAERDRRGRVRHPVGCEVSWRSGWKRNRGWLLDISREGCCLLVENSPQAGAPIAIKIPAETVGGKALKLTGQVLRSTPNAAHSGRERTALGVLLDDIGPAARKTLADLCERWSEGPPELPRTEPAHVAKPEANSHGEVAQTPKPPTEDSPTCAAQRPASAVTRSSTRRGVFEREIVEIDDEARVVQALLGRDLSVEGIRVVRQLGLAPGNRLRIALFDTPQQEPLILSAEVASDDRGSGLFLHFVDLTAETTARIEGILARLPAVESIDPHGDAQVVPAGLVANEA